MLLREERAEALDEERDVVLPFPQRRDLERDDREPVEQVLAEAPRLDLLDEVAVRRGDEAEVDLLDSCRRRA